MSLAVCEQKRRDDVILNRSTEYFICTTVKKLYQILGIYKQVHAQSVCTGPFPRVGRGLGMRLGSMIHALTTELLVDTFAQMAS